MADQDRITAQHLRERVFYDADTGIFTWRTHIRPSVVGRRFGSWDLHGYLTARIGGKSYKLHRLAWLYQFGVWPTGDVDHINGVRHDNRLSNLRDVSRKVNLENQTKATGRNNSTGLLGAYFDRRRGVFYARVSQFNKSINLGSFATAQEAHEAYLKAKRILHVGCTI